MNYYNEYDKGAAQWLRELIAAGEIPAGHVDERSIVDVRFSDLAGYTQCHFFAGIGGWSYALRLAGWPEDRPVWTGSCPCQPFSTAGKQLGTADSRHLWPAFFNLIRQCRPDIVFGEQVEGAVGKGWLDGVCGDLEGEGYACGAAVLGAHSVGAPHIRQRLYWVAVSDSRKRDRLTEGEGCEPDRTQAGRQQGNRELECDSSARWLADADGGQRRNGGLQPGRQHGQQPQDGGAGGLEHAEGDGREQRRPESDRRGAAGRCCAGWLGNPDNPRPQGRNERGLGTGQQSPWASSMALACTDGKTRRVEPSIFPLVTRIPGSMVPSGDPSISYAQASAEARVGRLRGYGNAIVPRCAQAFIEAYLDL